ncbi:MAG: sigma-E factor negative regulatory protein [Xanthomonadales bacterium]|nr:sigma-E factor negative regulatory protein [Xanthomonadales bacterium]
MSNSDSNSSVSSGELLSSFMDGEMDAKAAEFFTRRLTQDEQLQDNWSSWHTVRSCLRDEAAGQDLSMDLSSRVMAALDEDAAPEMVASPWHQRFMKPIASAAIAATVAMTAIVGVNQYRAGQPADVVAPAGALAAVETAAPSTNLGPVTSSPSVPLTVVPVSLENGPARQANQDPLARARLEAYLLRHYWQTDNQAQPLVPLSVEATQAQTQDALTTAQNGTAETEDASAKQE